MTTPDAPEGHGRSPKGAGVWRRLAILAAVAAAVYAIAWATGLVDLVRDSERFEQTVQDAGLLGPIIFVVLMTVLVPLGVPGVPLVLSSAAAFTTPVAIVASVAGGVTSSAIGVVAARRVGREALERRLPRWLAGFDARLSASGVWGVIALRLVLYLIAPADWLLGLSHLRLRDIIVGTAVGLVPPTFAYVLYGPDFFRWLVSPPGLLSLTLTGGVAAVAVILRRRARSRRDVDPAPAITEP